MACFDRGYGTDGKCFSLCIHTSSISISDTSKYHDIQFVSGYRILRSISKWGLSGLENGRPQADRSFDRFSPTHSSPNCIKLWQSAGTGWLLDRKRSMAYKLQACIHPPGIRLYTRMHMCSRAGSSQSSAVTGSGFKVWQPTGLRARYQSSLQDYRRVAHLRQGFLFKRSEKGS